MANEQKIVVGIETKADLTGVDQTKKAIDEVSESGATAMDKTSTSAKRIGQSLETSAKQGKSAGGSLNQTMGKVGQTIESSISGVKKLGATLQSIVSGFGWIGVITAAFAQIKSLYEWWNSAEIEKEAKQKEHAENEKVRQKEIADAANRSLIEINNQRATEKQIETVKKLNTELTETTKEIERQLQLKLDYLDAEQGIYDANQNLKRAKVENDYQNKVLDITKNTKLSEDDRDYALRSAKRDRDTAMGNLNDEQELRRQNVALQKSTATLEAMTTQYEATKKTLAAKKAEIEKMQNSGILNTAEYDLSISRQKSLQEQLDKFHPDLEKYKDRVAMELPGSNSQKKYIKKLEDLENRAKPYQEQLDAEVAKTDKTDNILLRSGRQKDEKYGWKPALENYWAEMKKQEATLKEETEKLKNDGVKLQSAQIKVDAQEKANQVNESTIQTNKQTRAATYQAEDETYRQQQIQKREAQDKANNPLLNLIDKKAPADSLQGGKSRFAEALIASLKNNILSSDEVAEIKKLMEELQANNMGSIIDEVLNTATQKKDISASLVNQLKELAPQKDTGNKMAESLKAMMDKINSGDFTDPDEKRARFIYNELRSMLGSKDKKGNRLDDKEYAKINGWLKNIDKLSGTRRMDLLPVENLLKAITNNQNNQASAIDNLNRLANSMSSQLKTMQAQARNSR